MDTQAGVSVEEFESIDGLYANPWRRLGANLIDSIIVIIALIVVGFCIGLVNDGSLSVSSRLITFLAIIAYFTIAESSRWQATPGKKMLGMKVTTVDGGRISFLRAVGRVLMKYVSTMVLFLGYVAIPYSKKRAGWHDTVAKTRVVKPAASESAIAANPTVARRMGMFIGFLIPIVLVCVLTLIGVIVGGTS